MLIKAIKYEDFNGEMRTDEHYFNLTKIELNKLLNSKDNIVDKLDKAIKEKDEPALIEVFEELVYKSYGIKCDDGKQFKKSAELSENFLQSAACTVLLDELLSDENAMLDFINGVIPAAVAKALSDKESLNEKDNAPWIVHNDGSLKATNEVHDKN